MGLTLAKGLRLSTSPCVAFIGAGGKTTAMFHLARELSPPVIITATTHLGSWQIPLADHHFVATSSNELSDIKCEGVTLFTGPIREDNRTEGLNQDLMYWLRASSVKGNIPLLIEADGSRQKPIKAPRNHEPPIPDFVETVVIVAGLSAIGWPLTEETVYFPELFSKLCGLGPNQTITPDSIVRVLCHPLGGQKNIPDSAQRIVLLNQADTPELKSISLGMVPSLLSVFDSVIITSLNNRSIYAAHEPVAGIILAAGASKRFGQPKQLLDWRGRPFVRAVAQTALEAGLSQVVVVTGANANLVEAEVNDLPVIIKRNDNWQTGQASSIRAGIEASTLADSHRIGAAVFLLADQPHIGPSVIRALIDYHAVGLDPIIAPLVMMEQRANPVLFDRITFPDLMGLEGDVGGRAIFSRHHVEYMPWHDDRLLLDVDKPEDYQRLIGDDSL
jgi:molybdenum cofactor cytidylyltransferase